jgi:hypothetical protein
MNDTHRLKTWPKQFGAVLSLAKTFEVRRADRDFKVGDLLVLQEWDPETEGFTGAMTMRRITYRLDGGEWGIEPGFCVLGLTEVLS